MLPSNSWTKSIILVVTIITMLKPTAAGFGDFIGSIVNTCQYTACESHPRCAGGYDTLSTTRDGCSGFKEKKYCCPAGAGPQCFFTSCGKETSCPGNYRELDRTKTGCSGFSVKAYCCKTTNLPHCFDMSCPAFAESAKSCPPAYRESRREKGRSGGCDSAFAERLTCCIRGNENGNFVNQNVNRNTDTEVVSETKTVRLEDGTIQTVTNTQTRSKSRGGLFSNSQSSFAAFVNILLLFPLAVALL
ncbi:uncharacterized protein LOC119076627 [Bradysia coprophila]|uniref:uncharacterized protein LOC119076627 n=1 Tax=Bradysia coprophila TaxID=38358 RepID=UPI00187DC5A5|nr:uncharacterized protein LOC119076627 [Bradysia coprophila]